MSTTYQFTTRIRPSQTDGSVWRGDPVTLTTLPALELAVPPTNALLSTTIYRDREETSFNLKCPLFYRGGCYIVIIDTMQKEDSPHEDLGPASVSLRFAEGCLQVLRVELNRLVLQNIERALGDPAGQGAIAFGSLTPRIVPSTLEFITPTLWRIIFHTDFPEGTDIKISQYLSNPSHKIF